MSQRSLGRGLHNDSYLTSTRFTPQFRGGLLVGMQQRGTPACGALTCKIPSFNPKKTAKF